MLCKNCRCVFWSSYGHPCLSSVAMEPEDSIETPLPLTPTAFLSFFNISTQRDGFSVFNVPTLCNFIASRIIGSDTRYIPTSEMLYIQRFTGDSSKSKYLPEFLFSLKKSFLPIKIFSVLCFIRFCFIIVQYLVIVIRRETR